MACYILHHIIITHWLKFIFIKVISTCHVMSLTYEHVLSNQTSYRYANIVQKIVDKKLYVNAKGKNGKVFSNLACGNNHDGVCLILCMVFNLPFTCFLTS